MRETITVTRRVSGRVFVVEVRAEREPDGELSISGEDLGAAETAIARSLASEGPVDGASFRFMRGALGLEAQRFAAFVGVPPETVSEWESGALPMHRAAWLVLTTLVLGDEGGGRLARLERLAVAEPPPDEIRLTL